MLIRDTLSLYQYSHLIDIQVLLSILETIDLGIYLYLFPLPILEPLICMLDFTTLSFSKDCTKI
jgi:hypothetical protein